MSTVLEYLGMALVLWAVWLIGGYDVLGQWVMLAAQAVWLTVALMRGMTGLGVQSILLGALTARAISAWSVR